MTKMTPTPPSEPMQAGFSIELPPLNLGEVDFSVAYVAQELFNGKDSEAHAHRRTVRRTFLRLVEHAVREYQIAAGEIARRPAVGTGIVLSPYIKASSHLETCITTMHRAARFASAPRKIGLQPPAPPSDSIRSSAASKVLADLRHAIQHLDERIFNDRLGDGPISPATQDGRLWVAQESIALDSLVAWLQELHHLAELVVTHTNDSESVGAS
jgi:hypothetical protein